MTMFSALVLGVVEGLTEFLPISSTGHLILVSRFLGIVHTDAFVVFEIAIQLGAILAVAAVYWKKLLDIPLLLRLVVAFIPTGIAGVVVFPYIKVLLDSDITVAAMLVLGGIAILAIESWYAAHVRRHTAAFVSSSVTGQTVTYRDSFILGCAQCLALVPGVSRSGAVMMAGLCMKMERAVVSEFAFLLALPTMSAATAYTLLKHHDTLTLDNVAALGVGFVTACVVAFVVVRYFLAYIRSHTFVPFGWYRIVLGMLLILFVL